MSGSLLPDHGPEPSRPPRTAASGRRLIASFFFRVAGDPRGRFGLLLLAGLLVLAGLDLLLAATAPPLTGSLRLELRSGQTLEARVFFDTGLGFVQDESVARAVAASADAQTLFFPLPPMPVGKVRITLAGSTPTLNLHALSVVRDDDGSETQAFAPESITGPGAGEQLIPNTEGLLILPPPGAAQTTLQLPLDRPITLTRGAWDWAARWVGLDLSLFALYAAGVFLAVFGWPGASAFVPRWENLWALLNRWLPDRWAALLYAVPVVGVACGLAAQQRGSYYLEAEVLCDRPVQMQFYFDTGAGFQEADSARANVPAQPDFRTVRFPISVERLTGFRFDPAKGPVRMRVNSVAVRSVAEDWLARPPVYGFNLRELWPLQQMTELVHEDDGTIRLLVVDGATEPATKLKLPAPLSLGVNWTYVAMRSLVFAAGWALAWILVVEIGLRLPAGSSGRAAARVRAVWRRLSPAQAVWLVAAASVVLSCYPVVFCGKSFASVHFEGGSYPLDRKFPTPPGTTDANRAGSHGAEVGAMPWEMASGGVLASRALLHDGVWPLWDRYSGNGAPLLGRGQSMVGDPLHWLVLAAGGRAWAWDVKFLMAKLCFAAGVGLLVLSATGSLPAALLLGFSAAFIGFWACHLNGPAFFSLCYAPWIVFAWQEIARAATWRRVLGWTAGLVLIDWTELNSGSVPEAAVLLVYLNLLGLLILLLARQPVRLRFQRALVVAAGGLVFCLLAAPVLWPFFDTLRNSVGEPGAGPFRPLPSDLLIGFFDDLFDRPLVARGHHLAPAANFLVLLGVLLALSNAKRLLRDPCFVVSAAGVLVLFAALFGGLPQEWVDALPLAGSISRPETAFSTVLFVPLFVVAGFGLQQCLQPFSRRRWTRDLLVAAVGGTVMLAAYLHLISSLSGSLNAPGSGPTLRPVPMFGGYVCALVLAVGLLPFVLRRLSLRGPALAPVLLLACCLFLIHWRQGIQLDGVFGEYTPQLPGRFDLLARSPALDFLHADRESPFREAGLGANLVTGYEGIAGVESFNGPDAFASPYLEELETIGMKLTHGRRADFLDNMRLEAARRFYDLCNVRYYLTLPGDRLDAVPGLRLIGKLDLDVYRNETVWPRAFFVDRLQDYAGVEDYVREVIGGDARPFAAVDHTEYLLDPTLIGRFDKKPAGRTVVPASNYQLNFNGTSFDIDAPRAGVVVLAESFYPDAVSAWVDGRRVPVFRVNHAFRGIVVDRAGHFRVAFAYRPAHFTLALWCSVLGWTLLAALGWWLWRAAPGRTQSPERGVGGLRPAAPPVLAGLPTG